MRATTILDEIVAWKREDLAKRRKAVPLAELEARARRWSPPKDFAAALRGPGVSLIAEVKKASPSRGLLRADLDPVALAHTYAQNGAAAISVLTESRYFQGSPEHLSTIRKDLDGAMGEARPPLLRKDFLFDPYQIAEARACGADALLLIVSILGQAQLQELLAQVRELGMEALVEVHDEEEVATAVQAGARVIGINNRDLRTFTEDMTTTQRLRKLIPSDCIVVSESGIKTAQDMARLREWRVDAVLIGEALVTAPDVAAKIRELLA